MTRATGREAAAVVPGPVRRSRRRPRPGLGPRLLAAQLLVVLAGALTLTVVAFSVAPGLFSSHLDRAGETDPTVRVHAEEAFDAAFGIALGVAALVAVLTAAAVSAFAVRRLSRPIGQLARAADTLAAGDYTAAVPDARLGPEFDRLTAAFTGMAARLARTEATRSRLMADLAHELRTPVTTLNAHVDGLEDGVVPPSPATWEVMRDQLERLQRLATDLADLSAAEEHTQPLDRRPVDLVQVAATAVEAATPRYLAKGVSLTFGGAPGPITAALDTGRLKQVLANLLDNALRHTPPGGTVTVNTRLNTSDVVIEVADTGDGIPATELDAVFDRFHRLDTARARSGGGTGLGLTIARAIVTAHGGTLTAASAGPGAGAAFTIRIPGGTALPRGPRDHGPTTPAR
jgi:signal transduction histidine kinase